MNSVAQTKVRLIASPQSWIEDEAVRQLQAVAKLGGVRLAVGFPDLHQGKGVPTGAVFVTEGVIYPHLAGGDIGCGMTLFKTNLLRRDIKLDRWAALPFDLEYPWDGCAGDFLAERGLESTQFDPELGTLGGGSHFAELQAVEEILDLVEFKKFRLGKEQLALLVHNGSGGLGESILNDHLQQHGADGVEAESEAAREYLRRHDAAVRWARAGRELIAHRFVSALGADSEPLWDGCHNNIAAHEADGETAWVHRRGAVEAGDSPVVIAGSRGTLSYLVKPAGNDQRRAWSLTRGAGHKWTRSESRQRMRERFSARELAQTPLGGRVICEERDLLYEEAPDAFKNIEAVVGDLVDAGLVSVIATFRPLLTYKTRKRQR